jgi:tRNA nucleotidyltransferase/poly(A) polymerase
MSDTPEWLNEPALQLLLKAAQDAGGQARVVGGAVRDFLIDREGSDVDVASTLLPEQTMAIADAQQWKAIPTGIAHGTVTLVLPTRIVEVTTLRRDVTTDGRRATVAFTEDWKEDAARRDFTINALSMDAQGALYDYFDGQKDIAAQHVRFIGDAATRIAEDGLRMLRFFRFLAVFGKPPADVDALTAITDSCAMITALSGERVAQEMKKLLGAHNPAYALRLMQQTGVAPYVFGRTIDPSRMIRLQMLEGQADYQTSVWARALTLLPNAACEDATWLCERWKLSRHEAQQLRVLMALNEPSTCKGEGRVGVEFRRHSPKTIDHARTLRTNTTEVEKMLWKKLSHRQTGYQFRRQHPIQGYIVDFACTAQKLAIELDGGQHGEQEAYDRKRTRIIEAEGYRVLRFWNHDILENLEGVYSTILDALKEQSTPDHPHPTLPLAGGGLSPVETFNALPRHAHTRILRLHGAPTYLDWLLAEAAKTSGLEIAPCVHLAHDFKPPIFPITAKDLISKGMKEGKALGERLAALEQRWEESDYQLTKDELLK